MGTRATLEKPRREANLSRTRILIHQRGHLNPSKRRQRSQEERPIRQNKDIDPSEGASRPTKATLEKPRREANPSNQDINSSEGIKITHQRDVREAKEERPIRQNKDIHPSEGASKPTKATSEKPRRGANPSNQDINPSEGVKPTHQSDVREAKKRANPSNKDINPSEGVNQPTKRDVREAKKRG